MNVTSIVTSGLQRSLAGALISCTICLATPALAQMGGGIAPPRDEISEAQRERIKATIEENRTRLVAEGKLSRAYTKAITNFTWPMRFAAGRTDRDYNWITNFVDENDLPVSIRDYNCTARTYDGHKGIDIGTWPFTWKKVEEDDVVIVAGAPGTIVNKVDGFPDRSCTTGPESTDWNAIYVQHADGSVAWYGHMKRASLTSKGLGDTVVAGEYLGVVGSSGFSTGPHLHLELYDAANNLVDPYLGACNAKSKQVTWQRQRPFREPTVNALTIGTALPVSPACPGIETPNATDFVAPGSTVLVSAYLRDQALGLTVTVRVLRPDGSVFAERISGPGTPELAGSSFWYWTFDNFPNTPGTWTADATIAGKTTTKTFQVGSPSFGAPASAVVMAGSVQTTAPGMVFAAPLRVQVFDAQARAVPGARVTFTAPSTGASAVLESTTALTDASGIASVAAIANSKSGAYAISAAVSGMGSPVSIALTNAAASTALTRAPTSVDFGSQSMRTASPAQAITLTNGSGASLTVSSIAASSSYAVAHNCGALAAGASCTANATFTPAGEDALPGALTIETSAGTQGVVLAGIGERSLVGHYYRSILRRAPDAGGKTFWDAEAARVQTLGVNVNEVWYAMAGSFYSSAEYVALNRDNTGFVTDLFGTFFSRTPDDAGLAYWKGQLDQGLPREVALAGFMFSSEFGAFTQAIFGSTSTRKEVDTVVDFYRGLLGSLPDDGGFNYWLGLFRAAQCQGGTAVNTQVESISSAFATSAQYTNRGRTDAQYVGDLYNAFLRRGGDLGGVQFWISQISSGARTRENVRQQFVASPEFQARVASIIAQGCLQ